MNKTAYLLCGIFRSAMSYNTILPLTLLLNNSIVVTEAAVICKSIIILNWSQFIIAATAEIIIKTLEQSGTSTKLTNLQHYWTIR